MKSLRLLNNASLVAASLTTSADVELIASSLTTEYLVVGDTLSLATGAVLSSPATSSTVERGLSVQAVSVLVDPSSRIDVTAKGYLPGYTLGLTTYDAISAGGSHGGYGALASASVYEVYGDYRTPATLGSGAGSPTLGGSGGGRIKLVAGNLVLDGMIKADGQSFVSNVSPGGGAGGSVWLDVARFSGAGSISARGGAGQGPSSGAGGGGRVAVHYEEMTFDRDSIDAAGGVSIEVPGYDGAAGTLHFEEKLSGPLARSTPSKSFPASLAPAFHSQPLAWVQVLALLTRGDAGQPFARKNKKAATEPFYRSS